MITLALDTSTKTASIALLDDEELLSEVFLNLNLHHCITLLPAMENLTRGAGMTMDKVGLLACTIGPGSFTGLRIGVSTVKGLALTMGSPVVGVSTLDALALNVVPSSMTICPMLDAGKEDVYTARYMMGSGNMPERAENEKIINIGSFLENLDKNEDIIFAGNGAVKHRGLIRETLPGRSFFVPNNHQFIRAAAVGLLGLRKFKEGDVLDFINFTPIYLRPSEAHLKAFPGEKQEKY